MDVLPKMVSHGLGSKGTRSNAAKSNYSDIQNSAREYSRFDGKSFRRAIWEGIDGIVKQGAPKGLGATGRIVCETETSLYRQCCDMANEREKFEQSSTKERTEASRALEQRKVNARLFRDQQTNMQPTGTSVHKEHVLASLLPQAASVCGDSSMPLLFEFDFFLC